MTLISRSDCCHIQSREHSSGIAQNSDGLRFSVAALSIVFSTPQTAYIFQYTDCQHRSVHRGLYCRSVHRQSTLFSTPVYSFQYTDGLYCSVHRRSTLLHRRYIVEYTDGLYRWVHRRSISFSTAHRLSTLLHRRSILLSIRTVYIVQYTEGLHCWVHPRSVLWTESRFSRRIQIIMNVFVSSFSLACCSGSHQRMCVREKWGGRGGGEKGLKGVGGGGGGHFQDD